MLDIRPINEALQKKAIEEINEDPARIEKDIEALREWIKKSPHLIMHDNDQLQVALLRCCKYRMEKAKQKLDIHFTLKTHMPDLMKNRDLTKNPQLHNALNAGVIIQLPLEAPDSPRHMLIRVRAFDPSVHTLHDITKITHMIGEMMFGQDDNYTIAGAIIILDYAEIGLNHVKQITLPFLKETLFLLQDENAIRVKAQHFLNVPTIGMALLKTWRLLVGEKHRQRIHLHVDEKSLFKVVPRKVLPEEYGGEALPVQGLIDDLEKRMVAFNDYFIEDEKYGVDESKRIGQQTKYFENFPGINGSFRQLTID